MIFFKPRAKHQSPKPQQPRVHFETLSKAEAEEHGMFEEDAVSLRDAMTSVRREGKLRSEAIHEQTK